MGRHDGPRIGLRDPWFTEHGYTASVHCGEWLRVYVGGMAELIEPSPASEAEELAKVFHAALLENPDCVAWEWHELNDEHRAWKIKAAQAVIDAGWTRERPDVSEDEEYGGAQVHE